MAERINDFNSGVKSYCTGRIRNDTLTFSKIVVVMRTRWSLCEQFPAHFLGEECTVVEVFEVSFGSEVTAKELALDCEPDRPDKTIVFGPTVTFDMIDWLTSMMSASTGAIQ